MRPFDDPPVTTYAVVSGAEPSLHLEGPTPSARLLSGGAATFGAGFAAVGLSFLRAPAPLPFRLIPLALAAAGAGLAALEGTKVALRSSIVVGPGGVTFRWRRWPLAERQLEVPAAEVEALEITEHEVSHADFSRPHRLEPPSSRYHLLRLVKKDGTALSIERFATHAQANLRKRAFEAALRPPPAKPTTPVAGT